MNNTENDQKQVLNTAKIKQINQNDFLHWIQMIIVFHNCCVTAEKTKHENQWCFYENSHNICISTTSSSSWWVVHDMQHCQNLFINWLHRERWLIIIIWLHFILELKTEQFWYHISSEKLLIQFWWTINWKTDSLRAWKNSKCFFHV